MFAKREGREVMVSHVFISGTMRLSQVLSQTSNTPVSQCYLETGKKGEGGLVVLKDIIDTLFVSV